MGFPESVLTSDEHVVMHLHPHWKAMVRPFGILLLVLIGLGVAWYFALPSVLLLVLAAIGLALVIWLTVWPFMKWRATHFVFTNERVIMREGVFGRDGRDIPLDRVNDVSFHHSFFERLLGTGTLTIESAGERGQVVLHEIPKVEKVQSQLYELVEHDSENIRGNQDGGSHDGETHTLSHDKS